MKHGLKCVFLVLFWSSFASAKYFDFLHQRPLWRPMDRECPAPDALNRYIHVPLFHDLKKIAKVQNIPGLQTHDELRTPAEGRELKVYYELAHEFDAKKKTLLFIPGGPGQDHTFIHSLAPLFAKYTTLFDDYNVIAMDHRGVGCSAPLFPGREPVQSLLMREAAADIELIRHELLGDSGKLLIWGGSYGTMLGQTYALLFPDRVERLFLWEAFSAAKDFSKAQRKYETMVVSSVPVLKEQFSTFKVAHPEWATKFLSWTVGPWYSYAGRLVLVPTTFLKLKKAVDAGDLKEAESLVKRDAWIMEWMSRSIACTEIFNWKSLYPDEFQLFGKNMGSCSEFDGQEEYFDYTDSLSHISAPTFIYSGFYDHVTPYEAMLKMHSRIPQNYMYLDPHSGHGVDKPECFVRMTQAFFSGARDADLDSIAESEICRNLPVLPAE